MSDEPKFMAKTIRYLPTKSEPAKGQLDNFLHSRQVFSDIKQVAPTIPTVDISVNTREFKKNIQGLMDAEPLTNNFFLFSSRRRSEKIMMERDRVNALLGIIDRAIETNRNIINYNVDVFITQQMLERLALEHSVNIEKYARAVLREEELLARLHIDNLDKVDDEYRLRKSALDKAELENERIRLENARLKAQTDEAVAKINFIKEVLGQVNVKNMPSTMQAYITATIINPNGSQFNDFDMQEQLKEFVKKEADARAMDAMAKAEQEKDKTEHQKWKYERQRKKDEV